MYKTTRLSLLMAGFVSLAVGCQPEEPGQVLSAGLETRESALEGQVGTWAVNAALTSPRWNHSATLINSTGEVLVVGDTTAALYDPYANAWRAAAPPSASRTRHSATRLDSGKVLVAGGFTGNSPIYWRNSAELYDPATNTWASTGRLSMPRGDHTATLLDSGKVLVVGGVSTSEYPTYAELYDPATGTWSHGGSIWYGPRTGHTATVLYSRTRWCTTRT
jgi:N-acetylneuraminic acid mutarotase